MNKHTICASGSHLDLTHDRVLANDIYISTSYEFIDGDIIYPRHFNTRNQKLLSNNLRLLENAEDSLILSSGMSSITSVLLTFLVPGDHIILFQDLYGGVRKFVSDFLVKYQISYDFVNSEDEAEKKANKRTKIIYFESPSNPYLNIVDLSRISLFAKKNNIITVIDNTFATPIGQNPINFGIDVVVHSGTKYLCGHSDLSFGVVISDSRLIKKIKIVAEMFGGNINGITAYLIERSLKTLGIRFREQSDNALKVARFLETSNMVKKVFYPGLESHSQFLLAQKQMAYCGGIVTFLLDDQMDPRDFLGKLKLIVPAISLGGVSSTICLPSNSSQSQLSKNEKKELGIQPNLLRLSVGIEDSDDIINDLNNALGNYNDY